MPLRFRYGDRHFAVELEREGDDMRVTIEGREYVVQVHTIDDATLALQIDGRRQLAHLARDGARRWLAVAGRVFELTGEHGAASQGHSAAADPQVVAPMPGKVLQVLVSAGARVEAGDALLILEAMKMENQLAAPAAAVIEEVRVAAGDMVQGGQLLLVLRFD